MLISLVLVILFLALCILLATQPWPALSRPIFWWKSNKQSPSDSEIKIRQDVQPYQFPPLKEKPSSKMSMGLKRLDESNWLTLDSAYLPEHALRDSLMSTNRPNVVQMLPGSEAACHELLQAVTTFLSSRFPQHFAIVSSPAGPTVVNRLTNEIHPIGPSCPNPLEVAARLSMEDFNILIKDRETGEYHLQASATIFPAGWKLQERIGTSMANLHRPVPGWKQKLGPCVNRFVLYISSFMRVLILDFRLIQNIDISTTCPTKRPWSAPTFLSRHRRTSFRTRRNPYPVLFRPWT